MANFVDNVNLTDEMALQQGRYSVEHDLEKHKFKKIGEERFMLTEEVFFRHGGSGLF